LIFERCGPKGLFQSDKTAIDKTVRLHSTPKDIEYSSILSGDAILSWENGTNRSAFETCPKGEGERGLRITAFQAALKITECSAASLSFDLQVDLDTV
jgi:hypothetical protein